MGRSKWLRGLSHGSAATRFLWLLVRIPPGAWMCVSCECGVSSSKGLCVGLIACPEESYRVWCVQWVWSRSPIGGGSDQEYGRSATKKSVWDVSGSWKGPVAGNRRSGPIKGMNFETSWVTVSWSMDHTCIFRRVRKIAKSDY